MELFKPLIQNKKLYCPSCADKWHRIELRLAIQKRNGLQLYYCPRCGNLFKIKENQK